MIRKYFSIAIKYLEEKKFSGVAVALALYILVVFLCFTTVYERFELNLFDIRLKLMPSIREWDRLVFLDIDENSITLYGDYPWPRSLYARGLKTLKEARAGLASFDMMFLDSSPKTIDDKYLESLEQKAKKGIAISSAELEGAGFNKDKIFADSIASMNRVVLSYTFTSDAPNTEVLERRKKESFKKAQKRFFERASIRLSAPMLEKLSALQDSNDKNLSYPIPELMSTARGFGFVNRDTDIDGIVRKVQLVKVFEGRLFFNLALVMLMDASRASINNVDVIPGSRILLKNAVNPITQAPEDITIPIDDNGMMYVTWAATGIGKDSRHFETFRALPFATLLEYPVYAEAVKKIFAEEDANKASQLGQLNGQLAEFIEESKDADPATKETMSQNISSLKGKIETLKKNGLLKDLEPRLERARKEFATLGNKAGRQQKWSEIIDLSDKINSNKLEYRDNYTKTIDSLKKELAAGGNDEKRVNLKQLEATKNAIDLVIHVEGLADSIALTGLTAAGTSDIGAIPIHKAYARVGTYHNTINTIVQKKFINKVPLPVNFFIMLIVALVTGFVIQRLNAKRSLITIAVSFVVLNLVVMLLFDFLFLWFQQVGIALSMIFPSFVIVGIKFMKEESQKRFIKGAFSYYLSPSVIEEIIKDPGSLELGGEDREITIFFSDIKSFSTISEKLTAQQLVKRLNEYLTEMTDIILKYNGTVDKYIGDAIMAFYGAPIVMEDHPLKACMAVVEMKRRLRELQESWRKAGLEEIYCRMGVNSGKATVGNMGSRTRMDYTAMGDAVNLASRLEGANKFYETSAMISGSTYEKVKDRLETRHLDIIRVVGKSEPVSIYELMAEKGSLPDKVYDMLEKYNKGREHFVRQDWKEARQMFRQGLKVIPDDGPCRVYVERCETYMKSPPKKGWDGVYVLKAK